MMSNHSFFNPKFFKETFKQHYAGLAFSILIFNFLILLMTVSGVTRVNERMGNNINTDAYYLDSYLTYIFKSDYYLMGYIFVVLGIGVAYIMFKHLHSKKQVDLFHSMPISRTTLFFNNYIMGLVLVIPVYIITLIVSYLYADANAVIFNLTIRDALIGALINLTIFILSYNISVIANILCGNSIIAISLSILLIFVKNLINSVFIVLTGIHLNNVYYSYADFSLLKNSYINNLIGLEQDRITNISVINNNSLNTDTLKFLENYSYSNNNIIQLSEFIKVMGVYAVISVVLLLIALFLYKKRGSETAGNCLSFEVSKPIFKYLGVVIFSILGSYLIVGSLFNNFHSYNYIGIIILCILLHCIIEIIYNFDFKSLFKNYIHIVGCIIVSIGIILIFKYDLLNIDNKVPDINKIESASLIDIYPSTESSYSNNNITPAINLNSIGNITFTEEQDLQNFVNFHTSSIQSENNFTEKYFVKIKYTLTNGTTFTRRVLPNKDSIQYLENLVNSQEYLNTAIIFNDENFISNTNNTNYAVSNILLKNNRGDTSNFNNLDPNLINNFLDILISDINKHGLIPSDNALYVINNLSIDLPINYNPSINYYTYSYNSITVETSTTPTNNITNLSDIFIYDTYTDTIDFIKNNIEFEPLNLNYSSIEHLSFRYFDNNLDYFINKSLKTNQHDETIQNIDFIEILEDTLINTDLYFRNFGTYANDTNHLNLLEVSFFKNNTYQTLVFNITDPELIDFIMQASNF